ncbi:hypothetical protein ACI65C_002638 [Semiaphis heraclei]
MKHRSLLLRSKFFFFFCYTVTVPIFSIQRRTSRKKEAGSKELGTTSAAAPASPLTSSVPNKSPNQSAHSELEDGWTTPTVKKRANPLSTSPDSNPVTNTTKFVSQNRLAIFSDPVDETEKMEQDSDLNEPLSTKIKPPPPIFIRTVKDYKAFCDSIKEITKGEPFLCKSSINGIKLSTSSADSYRTFSQVLMYILAGMKTGNNA